MWAGLALSTFEKEIEDIEVEIEGNWEIKANTCYYNFMIMIIWLCKGIHNSLTNYPNQ